MHYHLEIVMQPTSDVVAAVKQILAPFYNNLEESDDHRTKHAFWDFCEIGGRYSGDKLMAALGKDRIDGFMQALRDAGITVSGAQFGKPTLQPSAQAKMVDAMWRDAFPDSPVRDCPLFDNYKGTFGDVMALRDCPKDMSCNHVIIAGPTYDNDGLEALCMFTADMWNGVNYQRTTWDKTVGSAISEYAKWLKNATSEYAATRIPNDDWLVVTVDYHS